MLSEFMLGVLKHVWDTLQAEGVPMAVMGGIAVSTWDHFRATKDVDLLVGVESEGVDRIVQRLAEAGVYARKDPPILTIDDVRIIQFRYRPPESYMAVQIDLLIADSEFHRQALARRRTDSFAGLSTPISVVAPDDLILLKLIAGRIIDFADAAYVLRFQRDKIDLGYLVGWVNKLNLNAEFKQIWEEAFPGETPPLLPDNTNP